MRKKLYILFLLLLIQSIQLSAGEHSKRSERINTGNSKHTNFKHKTNGRFKRSLQDIDAPFWKKELYKTENPNVDVRYYKEFEGKVDRESPFWGTRGRRDGFSVENFVGKEYPVAANDIKHVTKNCKQCYNTDKWNKHNPHEMYAETAYLLGKNQKGLSEDEVRGFRGRRQENEPFWGARGRREDDAPFWGNRGRREEEGPFWGNRGRRQEMHSSGTFGRRNELENMKYLRHEDVQSLWDKTEEPEPFWGNRGRRRESENKSNSIMRLRRSKMTQSFWNNRGRDSQLQNIFDDDRPRLGLELPTFSEVVHTPVIDPSAPKTMLDDRIFAEQPQFVILGRSSRSSAEEDPYFIARGKKKLHEIEIVKAARDRRGAIEELVKSVRNDPYYIARGKKDLKVKVGNSTLSREQLGRLKDLICATVNLIVHKTEDMKKVKREIDDNDRDRRTILKKLTAQLQMDPYFVSRGKKNDDSDHNVEDFINGICAKCN